MNVRKRRECCVMGECLLFTALEQSDDRIIQKHRLTSAQNAEEGIKMLHNLTAQYLRRKRYEGKIPPTFGFGPQQENNGFCLGGKKQLISQQSSNSYTEPKRCFSFEKSEIKKSQQFVVPQSSKKKRLSEAEQLRESLKKLDLYDQHQDDNDNYENTDNANLQYLKEKTVAELIMESNRKMEEKLKHKQQQRPQRELSSDSSYPMTDYSSNESSNDNQYQEELISEQTEPKQQPYKPMNCASFSQKQFGGTGYQAMKLMYSPKKSKSKAKRLYIHRKRVPRWAEDLNKVNDMVHQQKRNPKYDTTEIYGICLVEKLDTNVIFNGNEIYHRGSSARWNRHPYSQFD